MRCSFGAACMETDRGPRSHATAQGLGTGILRGFSRRHAGGRRRESLCSSRQAWFGRFTPSTTTATAPTNALFVCGHNVHDAPPTYLYMNGGAGLDLPFPLGTSQRWRSAGVVPNWAGRSPDIVLCGTTNGMSTRALRWIRSSTTAAIRGFSTNAVRLPTPLCGLRRHGGPEPGRKPRPALQPIRQAGAGVLEWQELDPARKLELPVKANFIASAQLIGDERPDLLAVTGKRCGAVSGKRNRDRRRMLRPTSAASVTHCAIADLDADRRREVVAAVGNASSASVVFWNDGKSFDTQTPTMLPTSQAKGCTMAT